MKKIVSIVAALAMATAMFADEPAFTGSVTEFNAEASVTWGIDLDRGTTGFSNASSGNLKVGLVGGGSKATSSDEAVWGEISVATDGLAIENGSIANGGVKDISAKLHVGPAWIGIMTGDTQVGGYKPALATAWETLDSGAVVAKSADKGINIGYKMDKMFSVELNFRSKEAAPMTPATDKYFTENENRYSDMYALSLDATFDMVENLGVAFGVSKNLTVEKKIGDTDATDVGLFAKADYKLALGDSKFYVKPGVGASWCMDADWDTTTTIAAGVLLGWGAENQDTNIKWIPKNVSDGVSVGVKFDVLNTSDWVDADNNGKTAAIANSKVLIGVWDSAKLVPNLTFGAHVELGNVISKAYKVTGKVAGKAVEFKKDDYLKTVDNTVKVESLIAEAKYAIDLDGKTITPKVAAKFASTKVTDEDAAKKLAETGDLTWKLYATGFYCGVEFAGFVPYTTFSVDYETKDATVNYMYKGHLDFTCKIAF